MKHTSPAITSSKSQCMFAFWSIFNLLIFRLALHLRGTVRLTLPGPERQHNYFEMLAQLDGDIISTFKSHWKLLGTSFPIQMKPVSDEAISALPLDEQLLALIPGICTVTVTDITIQIVVSALQKLMRSQL